jgi:hypothetical protein
VTSTMAQELDLHSQIVSLFGDKGDDAANALAQKGYDVVVLKGDEGRKALEPTGDEPGLGAVLKKLAAIYGDELRIIERLDRELANGKTLVAVRAEEDQKPSVVELIKAYGGESVWHFGQWTFEKVGGAE